MRDEMLRNPRGNQLVLVAQFTRDGLASRINFSSTHFSFLIPEKKKSNEDATISTN